MFVVLHKASWRGSGVQWKAEATQDMYIELD